MFFRSLILSHLDSIIQLFLHFKAITYTHRYFLLCIAFLSYFRGFWQKKRYYNIKHSIFFIISTFYFKYHIFNIFNIFFVLSFIKLNISTAFSQHFLSFWFKNQATNKSSIDFITYGTALISCGNNLFTSL